MYLEDVRREEPGRFADRSAVGINLGPAIDANTSAHKIYLIKDKVIKITNEQHQAQLYALANTARD